MMGFWRICGFLEAYRHETRAAWTAGGPGLMVQRLGPGGWGLGFSWGRQRVCWVAAITWGRIPSQRLQVALE